MGCTGRITADADSAARRDHKKRNEHRGKKTAGSATGEEGMDRFVGYGVKGVPDFTAIEFTSRNSRYCLLIPVFNEGARILTLLGRAQAAGVDKITDVIVCDGGSRDGSVEPGTLESYGVNTLLIKSGPGQTSARLRMGIWYALQRDYRGILTIDGANRNSIEDVPRFIRMLEQGYDFVLGSQFCKGGKSVNMPILRWMFARLVHAPLLSLTARHWFTDTTNPFRGYSREYLTHPAVRPLRDMFMGEELLPYLGVRATQLGLKACEVPISHCYPAQAGTPAAGAETNSFEMLRNLFAVMAGKYNP